MAPARSPEARIEQAVAEVMDLTPRGIRTHLGLNRPIYARTSAYGHFGRAPEADGGFSWERTDLVEALQGRGLKPRPAACRIGARPLRGGHRLDLSGTGGSKAMQ